MANLRLLVLGVSCTVLLAGCGDGALQCTGELRDRETTTLGQLQYGNVTCVTQKLDKEATYGGE